MLKFVTHDDNCSVILDDNSSVILNEVKNLENLSVKILRFTQDDNHNAQSPSTNSCSGLLREGSRRRRKAVASICLTRSRVSPIRSLTEASE